MFKQFCHGVRVNMVDSLATVTTSNTGPVVTAGTFTYSLGCTQP